MRRRLPWILALAPTVFAAPARADEAAAAKALFDHGLDEMKRGRYEAGCPMLAESYARHPLPGALFTLAECEAKRGRVASAFKRYEEYLGVFTALPRDKQAKQHGRDTHSREQMAALAPQIPKIKLVLPARAGEVKVTIDGAALALAHDWAALGAPIPVDPGDHLISVEAPPAPRTEQRFTIALREEKTLTLDIGPPDAPSSAPDSAPPAPGGGLRIAGYVVGGLGLAALTAGAITGGLALGKKGAIEAGCRLDDTRGVATCDRAGLSAGRAVETLGAVSTATFIGGLVAAGAGVGLLVFGLGSSKKAEPAAARATVLSAGPGGVILGAEGTW